MLREIVEDVVIEALERGVALTRPMRVELSWSELTRIHGPFGSRFIVGEAEIQFVAEDLADVQRAPAWH